MEVTIYEVVYGLLMGCFIGWSIGLTISVILIYYLLDAFIDSMLARITEWEIMGFSSNKILTLLKNRYKEK